MPAPDPHGLTYDKTATGEPIVLTEIWGSRNRPFFEGNARHHIARANAVLMRLRLDGWVCHECGDPVPMRAIAAKDAESGPQESAGRGRCNLCAGKARDRMGKPLLHKPRQKRCAGTVRGGLSNVCSLPIRDRSGMPFARFHNSEVLRGQCEKQPPPP